MPSGFGFDSERWVMGHSISPVPCPPTPISTSLERKTRSSSLGFQRVWASHQGCNDDLHDQLVHRRYVVFILLNLLFTVHVYVFMLKCTYDDYVRSLFFFKVGAYLVVSLQNSRIKHWQKIVCHIKMHGVWY